MSTFSSVLSPFKFGNVVVKNRIELAPACYMLTTPDGFATREMIAYYQNLARGGAAIITIGESPIDFEYAKGHEFQLNLGDDRVINGFSRLVEAVHPTARSFPSSFTIPAVTYSTVDPPSALRRFPPGWKRLRLPGTAARYVRSPK